MKLKKVLTPAETERVQNEIYSKMPPQKKLEIASQLILLAKKLKEAEEVKINEKGK